MILVLLGTQNNSFERLLQELDRLVKEGIITQKVVVQAGYTKFESKQMEILDFVSNGEFADLEQEADLVITHGGVGSIISAIQKGKKVIAVPRLNQYNEHVNDHQKDIVKRFHDKHYIIGIQDVSELEDAYKKVKDFIPEKYEQNNQKMLQLITDFIDNI